MHRIASLLSAILAVFALPVVGNTAVAVVAKVQHHYDAKQLVGDKLNRDGHHDIDRRGKFSTSVEVKGGKIAALLVKHSEKGSIAVEKYKTHRKMAQSKRGHLVNAAARMARIRDLGEEYIGYSYIGDDGTEEIYWFPVEMVNDGDADATEYVPLSL
jgi:hypothetical protein